MVKTFKHKGLKRLYEKDDASLIGASIRNTVAEILTMLDEAVISDDRFTGLSPASLERTAQRNVVYDRQRQLAHHFPVERWPCVRRRTDRLSLKEKNHAYEESGSSGPHRKK